MTRTERGLVTAAAILIAAAGCQAHHRPAAQSKPEASKQDADVVDQMGEEIQADAEKTEKEMEADTEQSRDRLEADIARANAEATPTPDEAAAQAEPEDRPVQAEVEKVDRDRGLVTLFLKESRDEIQLQAGREVTLRFDELPDLTGLSEEDALDAMSEGKDFDVTVMGVGDAMKVAHIAVPKPKPE